MSDPDRLPTKFVGKYSEISSLLKHIVFIAYDKKERAARLLEYILKVRQLLSGLYWV